MQGLLIPPEVGANSKGDAMFRGTELGQRSLGLHGSAETSFKP